MSDIDNAAAPPENRRPSRWRPLPGDQPELLAWLAAQRGDSTPEDWPAEEAR